MKYFILSTLLGVAALNGCASTAAAPRELIDARAALQRANEGPASRLALVDLHNARQDLDRAEAAFRDDATSANTRDLSYIALRRAQIVDARGATLQAEQERQSAQASQIQMTSEQLAQTRSAREQSRQAQSRTSQELAQEQQRRAEAERQAQAALASLRQVAAVREESRGTVITLSGEVLFATGQSTLLPIAQQRLDQVARALVDQGARHLVVEGHTDSRGSATTNQQLSQARAMAVRSYLITRGVPESAVEAAGLGPSRPVADNDTAEGRANNRRVEIVVSPANNQTAGANGAMPAAGMPSAGARQ